MASKEKEKDDTRRKDKEVAAGDVTVASKTAALRKERVEDKSEHGENRTQSGAATRAVPPDRRTGEEAVRTGKPERAAGTHPAGAGRKTPAAPDTETTKYGTLIRRLPFSLRE